VPGVLGSKSRLSVRIRVLLLMDWVAAMPLFLRPRCLIVNIVGVTNDVRLISWIYTFWKAKWLSHVVQACFAQWKTQSRLI
jgi:hypothetical protein